MRTAAAALLLLSALNADARPKIGLALGGGGARGAAHVGVLRVLEDLHVPVDYIAGTSMGAVVGGLYASGMSPDEIEKALTGIDWNDTLNDRTAYRELTYRRKEDEGRYLTAFEAGLRGRRLALPSGLQSAQKVRFLLQSNLLPVAHVHDFAQLPIPFKAVAADIETGEAVVLERGDLAEAIRASMSIPGVFSPMEIDGRLLVDGGIANNVPVDVVRAMGADVVIAVDVGGPMLERDQLQSMFAVASQMLTILTRQNARAQLASADLVLTPEVARWGAMNFADAKEIIGAGAAEAQEHREALAVFADATPAQVPSSARDDRIAFVDIEGSTRVDPRIVRSRVRTKAGDPLDRERLRGDVARLYGLDDFQSVTFSVREKDGQQGLVVDLQDKPWGPTYVRFGIQLNDDLEGNSHYSLVANVTRTRLNALGAEWRNDIRIGHNAGFFTELYQPLDFRGRFFVAPSFVAKREKYPYYEGARRVAMYDVQERIGAVDLGMSLGSWGEVRAGVERRSAKADVDSGAVGLPEGSIDRGAMRAALVIVRTDNPTIPREGGALLVKYYGARESLGAADEYSKLSVDTNYAFSRGRQTFFAGGAGGMSLNSNVPAYDHFRLGGLLELGGFAEGQLRGDRFLVVRAGGYYRVRDLPATFGRGIYVGALVESGTAWLPEDEASLSGLHRSATLIAGADTLAGPILLGYARAETGDDRFYMTVGKTF
ncbi:MAG TPA: patatin-like phospholipase family protein [Thermoanaerobaculia bacterium]